MPSSNLGLTLEVMRFIDEQQPGTLLTHRLYDDVTLDGERMRAHLAYKDIDAVMAAQRDLVEVVHTLKQVVCVKG